MAQRAGRTRVGGYTQMRRGKRVSVGAHTKRVMYGTGNSAKARGLFTLQRATRHVTGRPARGKRPSSRGRNRWSRKKTAGVVLLGVFELSGWLVFRTLGLGLGLAATGLSYVAISLNGAAPRRARRVPRRTSQGVAGSGGRGRVVGSTKGHGSGAGKQHAQAAAARRKAAADSLKKPDLWGRPISKNDPERIRTDRRGRPIEAKVIPIKKEGA